MATRFAPVQAHALVRGDVIWAPDPFHYGPALDSNQIVLKNDVEDWSWLIKEDRSDGRSYLRVGNSDGSMSLLTGPADRIYVGMERI